MIKVLSCSKQMKYLVILVVIFASFNKSLKIKKPFEIWKLKSTDQIDAKQFISMDCKSNQISKITFNGVNLKYPQLCSYKRTFRQRLSYNFTFSNSSEPVPTFFNKIYVNETRSNGALNIISIGYIESGVQSLFRMSFIETMNYPNFIPNACNSVEGLREQVGTTQLILAKIEKKSLAQMFFTNTSGQLVSIFKTRAKTVCIASSVIFYDQSIQDEKLLRKGASKNSDLDARETRESFVESLSECEPTLSVPVSKIFDTKEISVMDSCDSVNLSDRYQSDISRFVVYTTDNVSFNVSVRLISKNANRIKGTYNEKVIGVVTDGPKFLIGKAYLRQVVVPNLNPYECDVEPGVTKLMGSAERIFSDIQNVQNLLSIKNIESLILKIRINKIVDCLGFITITYKPGLLSGT